MFMLPSLPLSLLLVISSALSVAAQSTSGSSSTAETSVSGSSSVTAPASSASSSGSLSGSSTSTASLPSFSGYSSCVDDCIDSAVAYTGCISIADVDCYCSSSNSTAFAQNLTSCMAIYCPSSIAPAESLSNRLCAVAFSSTSISFATTSLPAPTSASSSNASSSAPRTATSLSSSSASASATNTSAAVQRGVDGKLVITMAAGFMLAALGILSGL